MVRKYKSAVFAVLLAAVVILLALARGGIFQTRGNSAAADPVKHDSIDDGELIVSLNADNFSSGIAEGITLVDFYAPWCGPCRMQGPILEQVAESVRGRAKITKINVDDAGSVAGRFGVQSIPTLVLFENGKEVRRFVGVSSYDTLVQAINELTQKS
jgi:thioredoxin 1